MKSDERHHPPRVAQRPRSPSSARLVADLRAGGAIDNVNATLASVRQITDELAGAARRRRSQTVIDRGRRSPSPTSRRDRRPAELMASSPPFRNASRPAARRARHLGDTGARHRRHLPRLARHRRRAPEARRLARGAPRHPRRAPRRWGGRQRQRHPHLGSRAADAITAASADLPALVTRLNAVATRADTVLATVGPNSEINRETLRLLTEVRDAVRSVNALVQALERRPNSVIFGR